MPEDKPASAKPTLNDILFKRESLRRAATQGTGESPAALESTLADISAEVTAEALERFERAKGSS